MEDPTDINLIHPLWIPVSPLAFFGCQHFLIFPSSYKRNETQHDIPCTAETALNQFACWLQVPSHTAAEPIEQ